MKSIRLVVAFAVGCILVPQQAVALYLNDNIIPGKPVPSAAYEYVDAYGDSTDVFRTYLLQGAEYEFDLYGPAGQNFDLYLYGPGATDLSATPVVSSTDPGEYESVAYAPSQDGWHYLRVSAVSGSGYYTMQGDMTWLLPKPAATPYRISGTDRYATAVQIGRANFPGWANVDHVIIACGEDRAAADPLAASGLVWTYGAPILLVRSTGVPSSVMQALKDIRAANGPFTIHVVGGPVSVPSTLVNAIKSQVSGVTIERIGPYGSRYELAAAIATRMSQERPGQHWGGNFLGNVVLIANGEDPTKFFDALAMSPFSAATGFPLLLVKGDSIPSATANALNSLHPVTIHVAGGANTVSDAVTTQLLAWTSHVDRLWGRDRYETAAEISREAISRHYSPDPTYPANIGLAAKLPDALAGGAFVGLRRGSLLLTRPDSVPGPTYQFLHDYADVAGDCAVFGGMNSVSSGVMSGVTAALNP